MKDGKLRNTFGQGRWNGASARGRRQLAMAMEAGMGCARAWGAAGVGGRSPMASPGLAPAAHWRGERITREFAGRGPLAFLAQPAGLFSCWNPAVDARGAG